MTDNKKPSLRERKLAQPKAQLYFSPSERQTIIDTVAKGLTSEQVSIFFYTCQALGLNPLLNEIACVTYKDKDDPTKRTMSIQTMRDGLLTIAHRTGNFAGLESGVYEKGQVKTFGDKTEALERIGWARAYNKTFQVPVYQEADFSEYNTNRNLWTSKPKTMIKKVAEAMALRKAFNINGVYIPEEMDREIELSNNRKSVGELTDGDKPATAEQLNTIESLSGETKIDMLHMTKQQAAEKIAELLEAKK